MTDAEMIESPDAGKQPAQLKAAKLQKKAEKISFDWPDESGLLAKLHEELGDFNYCAGFCLDMPG